MADRLTALVAPHAQIDPNNDVWMPRGFLEPAEADLCRAVGLLDENIRQALSTWWLAKLKGARCPVWDIVATANVDGREGIVLVEAKAHDAELGTGGKSNPTGSDGSAQNDRSIRDALAEANEELGGERRGWHLSADHHYQLSNRFAWSWKFAERGIPVVLVYLGFLDADEMTDQGKPFGSAGEWIDVLKAHADGVIPEAAWTDVANVSGTPMWAMIRSARQQLVVG